MGWRFKDNTPPAVMGIPNVPAAGISQNYQAYLGLGRIFKDATNDTLTYKLTQKDNVALPNWLSCQPTTVNEVYQLWGSQGGKI